MNYITCQELKAKEEKGDLFQLIDTRDSDLFLKGHLKDAISIPQIDLPELVHLIRNDIPVIIYCLYGVKSQAPYLYLTEKLKFKNISILDGGIYQWSVDIDPDIVY